MHANACQANPATKLFAHVNIGKQRTRGAVMPQASSARVVEILRANLRYEPALCAVHIRVVWGCLADSDPR